MKPGGLLVGLAVVWMIPALSAAEEVKVEKAAGLYIVSTEVYAAKVDEGGALQSLVVGGTEFIAPNTEIVWDGEKRIVPGLFSCPLGQWFSPYLMPGVKEQQDNALRAEGNGWSLEYRFLPDAIELTYGGAPEGQRGFGAGYPPAEMVLSLAHELEPACDAEDQGELGWPAKRAHEPGNFAALAPNGAGLLAESATRIQAQGGAGNIPAPPHRLDLLVFNNNCEQTDKPFTHRIRPFEKADLAHSLTMEIISPNRGQPHPIIPTFTSL